MFLIPYISLAIIVLSMNVIPALMPPTWIVLAFFVGKYDLRLLPVVLIGAVCATIGRIILTMISRKYFSRFFSKESKTNYESIGDYLNNHKGITIPLMVTYAFIPIPSNHVFIAAGLAKVNIDVLVSAFFVGRFISYTFWVKLTEKLSDNISDIFNSHYSKIGSIVAELAGLLILYFIGKIAWKKILKHVSS